MEIRGTILEMHQCAADATRVILDVVVWCARTAQGWDIWLRTVELDHLQWFKLLLKP